MNHDNSQSNIAMISFSESYAGVFRSAVPSCAAQLQQDARGWAADVTIYEAIGSTLAIVSGNTHTESVGGLLDRWHKLVKGASFLGPTLGTPSKLPQADVWVASVGLSDIPGAVLRSVADSSGLFVAIDLASNAAIFVADRADHLFVDVRTAANSVHRYAYSWSNSPPPVVLSNNQRPYDPIGAQISEMVRQTLPSLEEATTSLSRSWNRLFPSSPLEDFDNLIKSIAYWRQELSISINDEQGVKATNVIDRIAYITHKNLAHCSDLSAQLEEYDVSDFREGYDSYLKSSSALVLHAARRYAKSLLGRLGVASDVDLRSKLGAASEYRVIVVLADTYSCRDGLFDDGFMGLGGLMNITTSGHRALLLSMPFANRLRLGSLALFAFELCDFVVRNSPKIYEYITSVILARHKEIFVSMMSRSGFKEFHQGDTEYNGNGSDTIFDWALIVTCDLMSCAIAGPSFVYAFGRFVPGTLTDFTGKMTPKMLDQRYPPMSERLNLCIAYMRSRNIPVNFNSRFHSLTNYDTYDALFDEIASLIPRPYDSTAHTTALEVIQPSLRHGNVVNGDPVLILNALWDAVVHRSVYVNELSVLYSIAEVAN